MIYNLFRLVFYLINIPVYYISGFVSKNNDIWIIGAWNGKRYSDNSKYFYEYVIKKSKIRIIWLTKDALLKKNILSSGQEAYHPYSFLGYYYTLKAKIIVVNSSFKDVNRFAIKNSISINLWHATNLKIIGCDIPNEYCYKCYPRGFNYYSIKYNLFPFMKENYDYTIAASQFSAKVMMSAFCLKKEQIIFSGLPRTDIIKNDIKHEPYNIMYLPTFRDDSKINCFLYFNEKKMNNVFIKNNMIFTYNLHFADKNKFDFNSNRILPLKKTEDLYEKLRETDLLITDYSSVFFDFLLTKKPIIFFPFDLENYKKSDRGFYYDYMKVTPGPKCYNWDEVLDNILLFFSGVDNFKNERDYVSSIFNTYNDFDNCSSLFEKIINAYDNH